MTSSEITPLVQLLSPDTKILHRTVRFGFEKRIVQFENTRQVLYRYYLPWQARQLAKLLRCAAARQLPLQRLQMQKGHWQDVWEHKGFWLVTSYIDGRVWPETEIHMEHATALAKALAGLHSIESAHAGLATSARNKNRPALKFQILSNCVKAVKTASHLERQNKERMIRWLRIEAPLLDRLPGFQLLHGDLTGKNVVVTEKGEIALIDYELFEYGFAGLELARALLGLLGYDRKLYRQLFLQTYLSNCPDEVRISWEESGAQLLIIQLLLLAYGRTVRLRNLNKRRQLQDFESCKKQFINYTSEALLLIQAFQANQRDPETLLTAIGR